MTRVATGVLVDPVAAVRTWLDDAAALPDTGLSTWTSTVGGTPIRFRCTDPAVAELYRARLVGSARHAPETPALRLDLLETEAIGWEAPALASGGEPDTARRTRRLVQAGLAALMPAAGEAYPWVAFDPRAGRGLILVRATREMPPWTAGAPFALLLHLAFAWRGWRLLHAAAIGHTGVGALLAGPGGVGKSGTTLACISHGMVTVGDDYLLIAPGERPVAWPVYRLLKQDPAGLTRVARRDLASRPVNWMGKVELDLEAAFPGQMARALELRMLLLPELAGTARTELSPVPPPVAFSAIAPSILGQLPGARMAGFAFLTHLTRALPAYRLRLSSDPPEIAATLRRRLVA